jgi:hypothetical protein
MNKWLSRVETERDVRKPICLILPCCEKEKWLKNNDETSIEYLRE